MFALSSGEHTLLTILELCFLYQSSQVAQIVKKEMETAVKLYVKLKAKIKAGPSWGNLEDLDI